MSEQGRPDGYICLRCNRMTPDRNGEVCQCLLDTGERKVAAFFWQATAQARERGGFTADEWKAVEWSVRIGLHQMRNDGFPNAEPAKSNIPLLESVLTKAEAALASGDQGAE